MGSYIIRVRCSFSAAHSLKGYVGPCARVHGHNWYVETEILAKELNSIGIACDFKDLKAKVKEIIAKIDHRNLNDIPPFDKINPTAENLASWLYKSILPEIKTLNCNLNAVTIWETDNCSVRYQEDD